MKALSITTRPVKCTSISGFFSFNCLIKSRVYWVTLGLPSGSPLGKLMVTLTAVTLLSEDMALLSSKGSFKAICFMLASC